MKKFYTMFFIVIILIGTTSHSNNNNGFRPVKNFGAPITIDFCGEEIEYPYTKAFLYDVENPEACGSINESKELYLIESRQGKEPTIFNPYPIKEDHVVIQLTDECPCELASVNENQGM